MLAAALSVHASWRASASGEAWSRRLLAAAAGLVTVAVVALGSALVRGDWSITYVADYTSRDTPWPYRLAALWAGMAGSLLLWAFVLGLWAVAAGRWCRKRSPALAAPVEAVLAVVLAVVTGLLVWASPPFARLEIPAIDGGGLTPVLRHPAMLYHPVLLYVGQVGLIVPFAIALTARLRGLPAGAWVPAARRWMLGTLAVLAGAVVAGAHWAYVELGWGGYWAWDPVENAALLPWLAGVAFLHVARRPRSGGGGAAARLAALTFVLALGGAILTRSGGTGSVHAFAEAGTVGRVLAVLLAALVAVVVGIEWRRRGVGREAPSGPIVLASRERALGVSAVVLGGLVAVIAAGTVLPLVRGDGSLVSGRYFAVVALPFALLLLGLAGVGPRLRWAGTDRADMGRRLLPAVAGIPAAAAAVTVGSPSVVMVFGAGLGGATAALTVAEMVERRGRWRDLGGLLSHLGVAVLLVGVLATATGSTRRGVLGPGQEMTVAGYTLRLEALAPADAEGPGAAVVGTVALSRGDERVATLRPKAMLSGSGQRVSVAGLRSTPLEDVQVTLRAVGPEGDGAVVDAAVLPLVQWVWWGGLLVAAGMGLTAAGAGSGRGGVRKPEGRPAALAQRPFDLATQG